MSRNSKSANPAVQTRSHRSSRSAPASSVGQEEIPDLSNFGENPEAVFFDFIREKTTKAKLFAKWASRFRAKTQAIGEEEEEFAQGNEEESENEPIEYMMQFRKMRRRQYYYAQGFILLKLIREKNVLDSCFETWFMSMQRKHRRSLDSNDESLSPSEIIGKMHILIQKQAELETALESERAKMADLESVFSEAKAKLGATNEHFSAAILEKKRHEELQSAVVADYEDKIASLRMKITVSNEKSNTALEEAKEKLRLLKKAKGIKNETDNESMESINAKLIAMKEELRRKKEVAIFSRSESLANQKKCEEISKQIMSESYQRDELADDVDKLEEQVSRLSSNNFEELRKQKEDTERQLLDMKSKIAKNDATKEDLSRALIQLTAERNAAKMKFEAAEKAFAFDEYEEDSDEDSI